MLLTLLRRKVITCLLPLSSCIPFAAPVAALLPTASSARGRQRQSGS
ncbi:hypothetical protein BZL29_8163 [Mycobacterium kansasii]|uniref:Uncharacterized protein n=1 Tax=Mycobacterium kansasii TaxID=1768 RepID=A0A1V3WCU4_MYCKA|nr:hypothetical protein BZL29_8163 [Mycobacterium kansasii]